MKVTLYATTKLNQLAWDQAPILVAFVINMAMIATGRVAWKDYER